MSTSPTPTLSPMTPAVATRSRARLLIGPAILLIGAAFQAFFAARFAEDPTFFKMSFLWVWPATLFVFGIWWLAFSGFSRRTRLIPVAALLVAGIAFFSVYRIEGSDGDMVPKFVSRWAPNQEELGRQYWSKRGPSASNHEAVETTTADPLVAGPDDWPDFRNAQRDGVVRGTGFRQDWDARPPRELWRHPVGLGWSSFVVLGNFAITQEQRDEHESVVCYDLTTGEQVWVHEETARLSAVIVNGGDGPRATPVISGDHTFALGGTGILNCLETRTGKSLWKRNILDDAGNEGIPAANIEWGVSAAPCVTDELVYAVAGGLEGKSVIAYERETGKIRWAAGNFPASYSGPRIEEISGVRQLLVFHGVGVTSMNPEDGTILWTFAWENMPKVNVAQPMKIGEHSLIIGTGYGIGATRLELAVGDGGKWTVTQGWKSNRLKLKFNDALLLDGYVYGLDDGVLTCLDAETGKTKWKGGRFGYGQIIRQDDRLLALTEEGDVVLAALTPTKYEELDRFKALDGTTWNYPTVAHGKLVVRNGTEAVCYEIAP